VQDPFHYVFQPSRGESPRVLLLLHGTGGDEHDMLPLGRNIDPTAAFLSLRGNVNENGANRFFRRLSEGVFDEEDIIKRAGELADFLDVAAGRYEFEARDLIAVGYSNGANIAAAMMLLGVAQFRRAILLRSMLPLTPDLCPDLAREHVLMLSGNADPIIPRDSAEQLAALLQKCGANVDVRWQDAGHELRPEDMAAAREWLV
jgi:predicted esterase